MTPREEALKEPGRPESLTFAMVYVGDQISDLVKVFTEWALHNDRRIEETPKHVAQPAKAAQSEPPRPMGGKKKPEAEPADSSRDQ